MVVRDVRDMIVGVAGFYDWRWYSRREYLLYGRCSVMLVT